MDTTIIGQLDGVKKLQEWLNLERTSVLTDGGGADTGGPNKFVHGSSTWATATWATVSNLDSILPGSTRLDFNPAKRPQSQPWDNVYRFASLTLANPCNYFGLGFDFAVPNLAGWNAREFEIELCESGFVYNMAWQYGNQGWRIFNGAVKPSRWEVIPGLPPVKPVAGKPVPVLAHFIINRSNRTCVHDSIQIDGQFFPVNAVHEGWQKWPIGVNYLHHAVQIDSDGKGTPVSVLIKNWNVRGL